jgi:hypothetical protein
VAELDGEELERLIVDAYRSGYARAVADFRLSCATRDGKRARRRGFVRAVLRVLGIG